MIELDAFHEIWCVDFEFMAGDGDRPQPICMVGRELKTGSLMRLWGDELRGCCKPPFSLGPEVLYVAYHASAELGCHVALGWPAPARILDLEAEYRCQTSGLSPKYGYGLIGAMQHHGLDAMDYTLKDSVRRRILTGPPFTEVERREILDYCQQDVDALRDLLPVMAPAINLTQALHRGHYTPAVARIEWAGTPIDVPLLKRLHAGWDAIKESLIQDVDTRFGVYEGTTFKIGRFAEYLSRRGIPWPRLESGSLELNDETFRDMANIHPELHPLRELRSALGQMRDNKLAVGSDGRNRYLLSQFASKTGRNQPSSSQSIFGAGVWLRGLIRPGPGRALAYIDWSQQEFGIAAYLSGDENMILAYASGDPYLALAKQAGAVPLDGIREQYEAQRALYKQVVLAVQYGMGVHSMAVRIETPENRHRSPLIAEKLLKDHHRTFSRFWEWSEDCVNQARLYGSLQTVFGWKVHVDGDNFNHRSMRNFPMQANGAEMMRLDCILATERGIQVCTPVHDALLIEAPADLIDIEVGRAQQAMAEASCVILDGFELRSDAEIVRYPDRYRDEERGGAFWDTVMRHLDAAGFCS